MILDAIFGVFAHALALLTVHIPAFPSADLSGLTSATSSVWTYYSWANDYVPADHAMVLLSLTVGAWAIFYGLELLEWLGTKLHFFGGGA
jgi:hypothetical protein